MTELRPEVQKFAEEMEKQLRANEHKGGWNDSFPLWLFDELYRNYSEFRKVTEVVIDKKATALKPTIIRRAANIANFAMMIADNWGGLMGEDKNA